MPGRFSLRRLAIGFVITTCVLVLWLRGSRSSGEMVQESEHVISPIEPPSEKISSWNGWNEVKNIFAFGDSWTTTQFNVGEQQPNADNPMGNPEFPTRETEPPSWLHYLTATYNQSFVKTYNIAHGAATIDRTVVEPHPAMTFTSTFREQVENIFDLAYCSEKRVASWNSDDTLFITWFGVVDLTLLVQRESDGQKVEKPVVTKIINAYEAILERLHNTGAKNFLILTAPPTHLAPDSEDHVLKEQLLRDFNTQLVDLRQRLSDTFVTGKVFLFDVFNFFSEIIKDPKTTPQTSALKNTTDHCWDYNPDYYNLQKLPPLPWDAFKEQCAVRLDEYFWVNALHPTWPVHEALAAGIVKECFQNDGRSNFCSK